MQITAQDLKALNVIDRIVPEPMGGAHRDHAQTVASLGKALGEELEMLSALDSSALRSARADKFLAMGQ
jgi:acetyl-CoA carboxylase carboxyl transferase subunit alpha